MRVLVTGTPVGERFTSAADATEYVRDPDGLLGGSGDSGDYQSDVPLPDDARDTGLRHNGTELWAAPDGSAVYLAGPEATERLPRAELPECA